MLSQGQGQSQGQGEGQRQQGVEEGTESGGQGSLLVLPGQGAGRVSVPSSEGGLAVQEGVSVPVMSEDSKASLSPLAVHHDDHTNMASPPPPTSSSLSISIPLPSSCDERDTCLRSDSGGGSGVDGDVASAIERVITRLRITADLQTQTSPMNSSSHPHPHQNINNHNDVQCQTLSSSSPSSSSSSSSASSSSSSDENKEGHDTHLYHENIILKTRITELVTQEKDMFSSLTQRLQELDEARNKLLRLKKSTHQHGLFVQDDTTVWGNGLMDTPLRDATNSDANKENFTSPPMIFMGENTCTLNTPS